MSNPFQPPATAEPQRSVLSLLAAILLYAASFLFAGMTILGCLGEVLNFFALVDRTLVGLVGRMACMLCSYGLISLLFFAGGRMVDDPDRFGTKAFAAGTLDDIYAAENLAAWEAVPPGDYADKPDHDLAGVYRRIDRERVPERFAQLLSEIKERVESRG